MCRMTLPPIVSIQWYLVRLELLNFVYNDEDFNALLVALSDNFNQVLLLVDKPLGFYNKYPLFIPKLTRKTSIDVLEIWRGCWTSECDPIFVKDIHQSSFINIIDKFPMNFYTESIPLMENVRHKISSCKDIYPRLQLIINVYKVHCKGEQLDRLEKLIICMKEEGKMHAIKLSFNKLSNIRPAYNRKISEIEGLYNSAISSS